MKPPLDYIISKPVYSVNEDDTVQKASEIMTTNGIKKILVKDKDGKPIGVLEAWKITPKDYPKKVKDIPLGKIQLMPNNSDFESVRKALGFASAVYITDPASANAIIGVVTSSDIVKAASY